MIVHPSDPMVDNDKLVRCPKCERLMAFHNVRTETDDSGRPERVELYLCFTHGFYRLGKQGSLIPGA